MHLEHRTCDNCCWAVTVGEDEVCLRHEIKVPIKGSYCGTPEGACMGWNKAGSIGMDHWVSKFYQSPRYIMIVELSQESMVGPIEHLHL